MFTSVVVLAPNAVTTRLGTPYTAHVQPGYPGIAPSVQSPPPARASPRALQTYSFTDWPMFLHDVGRTGTNPNESTIAAANASSLTKLWNLTTKSANSGSLILVNGTVYFGSWDGRLYAVDAYNGSTRWRTLLGGSADYTDCGEPGIAGTPAFWNDTVYIGGSSPDLFAVNAANGTVEWKLDLANASGSSGTWAATKVWSSPLLYNGSIYVGIASGCDNPLVRGMFFQIGLADHKIDHTFDVVPSGEVGGGIWASAAADPKTNTIWVTTGNEGTATQKYARAILELSGSNVSDLLGYWQEGSPNADLDFGDGATLFHSSTGRPMVVAVNKDGWAYAFNESSVLKNGTGQPSWRLQLTAYSGEQISPPAFGGGLLYFGSVYTYLGTSYVNGTVQAVSPDDGSTLWAEATKWPVYAGLAYADGVVAVGQFYPYGHGGEVTLVDATSGDYLANFSTSAPVYGEPIVAGGELFYATGNLSSAPAGGSVVALAIPLGGRVVATLVSGRSESTYHLSAHAFGGVGPFNVSWQFGDGGTGYGAAVDHSYGSAGSYLGKTTMRDRLGEIVTRTFNLTANAPLVASGTVSPNPVNLGNATTLSLAALGGTLPYTYAWSGLPPGITANGTTTATLEFASVVEGEFNITVAVGSPSGQLATVRFPPLWVDGPAQYEVTASPRLGIAPLMVQFRATSPYPNATGSYAWQFGDGAASSATAPSHLYFVTGQFPVLLTVRYPGGTEGRGTVSVGVFAPFAASLTPFAQVDRGGAFTLRANVSGGLGTYTFSWSGLPAPCRSVNTSALTCQPLETGSFAVAVTVDDPVGGSTVLYAAVVVAPSLALSTVAGSPAPLGCGAPAASSVGLSAVVTGGTPPYAVNWTGPGGTRYTGFDIQPRLPGAGNFSFVASATDLAGGAVEEHVDVVVPPASCISPSTSWWSSWGGITLAGVVAGVVGALAVGSVGRRRRRRVGMALGAPEPTESADAPDSA